MDSLVSCEGLDKIIIGEDEERYFQVEAQLPLNEKEELVYFLKKNSDVFAWSAYEASRVDPKLICHSLNVNPKATPKK